MKHLAFVAALSSTLLATVAFVGCSEDKPIENPPGTCDPAKEQCEDGGSGG
ncbi:MAG: hypothetical protein JNM74_10420, partial [Myxococcales bacterium]|nr:hypothetical protein [Myxococcales bacterium]